MTQSEFVQILSLLDEIRTVVVDRYNNIYMPQFNSWGGKPMNPMRDPIPFLGRISPNDLNEAIQETNVAYVYLLNKAVIGKPALRQWIHERYSYEEKIIDGVNHMSSLTNDIIIGKGTIPTLPLNASMNQMILVLQTILNYLHSM